MPRERGDGRSGSIDDETAGGRSPVGDTCGVVTGRLGAFGPLVGVALALVGAGTLVDATIGLPAALGEGRVFFQIVLAGAVMAVVRNEVGLRTYGLFAPVIIAFIMLAAGPFWGLALFVNVLVVAGVCYRALRPLKLGTAPRVAVLLSVAGIATSLAFAAADQGLLPPLNGTGGGGVFFPTIVSAWYADRAASDVEERGWSAPAKRLLGTLVAVVVAYLVVGYDPLVDWFVATPVAWGATLLAVAYLGSRPGFRVSELRRFDGHFDGGLGPLSVARARGRVRVAALRRRLARLAGREVDAADVDETDVLTMKRRNRYIDDYNPPHLRPAADEKAHVNRRLSGVGVAAPRTYAVIDDVGDVDAVDRVVDDRDEFVLKPSRGYGGEGIVVVSGRDGEGDDGTDAFDTSRGSMTADDLRAHARRIVDGHYSGLETDGTAILEEKLTPAGFMRDLHGDGVADVRVVVFQGFPVMAMARLPTAASDGAANLHLGAVGVGLSVADGTPLGAYQQSADRELDAHPDTGTSLTDFRVPNWAGVLEAATRAAAASGLGYTGVDVVLAEGAVPKVLEVNVRPGLGIQNTTDRGIFGRLSFVESLAPEFEFLPVERKIELARRWDATGYAADPTDLDPDERDPDAGGDAPDAPTADDAAGDGERPLRFGTRTAADGGRPIPDGAGDRGRVATGSTGHDATTTQTATDGADATDGGPSPDRRLVAGVAGAVAASLAAAGVAGFPVLAGPFALVAVVAVCGLVTVALGVGGDRP